MNLHEYQSKQLFAAYGVPVPEGKVAATPEEVRAAAVSMLGRKLKTKQTGAAGLPIHLVYVESGSRIARELYLSLLVNRDTGRIAFVASEAGGMDIEEVAEKEPQKILRADIHPATGLQGFQGRRLAFGLGLRGEQVKQF